MAGLTATSVRVANTGTIYVAPSGTAIPANVTAPWTGFTQLGYATEDGVVLNRSMDTEAVRSWQTIADIRILVTGVSMTAAFTLQQFDKDALPLYLGGATVTAQGGGSFSVPVVSSPTVDERVFGVEWTDTRAGATVTYRFIMYRAMASETGEMNLTRGGAITMPITMTTLANDPNLAIFYTNDSAAFA